MLWRDLGKDTFYKKAIKIRQDLNSVFAKHEYGANKTEQFIENLQRAHLRGEPFTIAGFICPLYIIDEAKLDQGFGRSISSIGTGNLEDYNRYLQKANRLLQAIIRIQSKLSPLVRLKVSVIMGDKGIINANLIKDGINLKEVISSNLETYRRYIETQHIDQVSFEYLNISDLTGSLPMIGMALSDLHEDGDMLLSMQLDKQINPRVQNMLNNERSHLLNKQASHSKLSELYGFALNYGLAGSVLRQRDISMVIGTVKPGSNLNHFYHSFLNPSDLLVEVAL